MGFTDRLLAAPIPRFAIVAGRLAGTAALGALIAVWFLAIGVVFGATIEEGVPGALLMIVLVVALGARVRRPRRGARAAQRQRLGRPGDVPARLRDPLPLDRVLPRGPAARAGGRRSPSCNPLSFIVDAVREPVISAFSARDLLEGLAGIVAARPRSG